MYVDIDFSSPSKSSGILVLSSGKSTDRQSINAYTPTYPKIQKGTTKSAPCTHPSPPSFLQRSNLPKIYMQVQWGCEMSICTPTLRLYACGKPSVCVQNRYRIVSRTCVVIRARGVRGRSGEARGKGRKGWDGIQEKGWVDENRRGKEFVCRCACLCVWKM